MTWREFLLIERNVVVQGQRSIEDAERALNAASSGEAAIFRGRVAEGKGTLRIRGLMNISARSLRFQLTDDSDGTKLNGVLQPTFWLKLYRGLFLTMYCLFIVSALIDTLRTHGSFGKAVGSLAITACLCAAFINGYIWLTVLFTRRIERTLLKSVEYVLRDDASAAVAADLLSSSR